jgi:predicted nucleic acid-binding protein
VITEAAWLLRKHPGALHQLLAGISEGFLELLSIQSAEVSEIGKVMEQYRSIHSQLADAALIYLAGRDGFDVILTLDRRDFLIYQTGRKHSFRIIP